MTTRGHRTAAALIVLAVAACQRGKRSEPTPAPAGSGSASADGTGGAATGDVQPPPPVLGGVPKPSEPPLDESKKEDAPGREGALGDLGRMLSGTTAPLGEDLLAEPGIVAPLAADAALSALLGASAGATRDELVSLLGATSATSAASNTRERLDAVTLAAPGDAAAPAQLSLRAWARLASLTAPPWPFGELERLATGIEARDVQAAIDAWATVPIVPRRAVDDPAALVVTALLRIDVRPGAGLTLGADTPQRWRARGTLRTGTHAGVELVELPLAGGRLWLLLAIPKDAAAVAQVRAGAARELLAWRRALAPSDEIIGGPALELAATRDLEPSLRQRGLARVLDPRRAELPGLGGPARVALFTHAALRLRGDDTTVDPPTRVLPPGFAIVVHDGTQVVLAAAEPAT